MKKKDSFMDYPLEKLTRVVIKPYTTKFHNLHQTIVCCTKKSLTPKLNSFGIPTKTMMKIYTYLQQKVLERAAKCLGFFSMSWLC